MSTSTLPPGALRHIAEQVIKHRRRVTDACHNRGLAAAHEEVSTFVMVGSRQKFLTDHEERVEFYAICHAMGRELDRLANAERARRNSERLARGYVSPALAAATT